jgi:chloramphenicol 3-O-phosphotransferase
MEVALPAAVVITGISAAGKSTVAQALAERLPRSVHLRGDSFRRMIVNDRADMRPDRQEAALEQLRLRHRLTAQALDTYVAAGFTVVAQDVLLGPMLEEILGDITTRPLSVVVLCPSVDSVKAREAGRSKVGYADWTVEELDRGLREQTPRIGLWLDNSKQTVEQTVDEILRRLPHEGLVS